MVPGDKVQQNCKTFNISEATWYGKAKQVLMVTIMFRTNNFVTLAKYHLGDPRILPKISM